MANSERPNIGAERMNEIIKLLMVHSMTIKEISEEMCLSRRMVCKYLAKLESMYKIRHTRPETGERGGKPKVYSAAFGVAPVSSEGPKPRAEPKKSQNVANPYVRAVKAEQVGMYRDPFTAALFGTTQRASA